MNLPKQTLRLFNFNFQNYFYRLLEHWWEAPCGIWCKCSIVKTKEQFKKSEENNGQVKPCCRDTAEINDFTLEFLKRVQFQIPKILFQNYKEQKIYTLHKPILKTENWQMNRFTYLGQLRETWFLEMPSYSLARNANQISKIDSSPNRMFTLAVHRTQMVLSGCQQVFQRCQLDPWASFESLGGIPTVNLVHKDIVIYNGN